MSVLAQLILRSVLVVAIIDGVILYVLKKRNPPHRLADYNCNHCRHLCSPCD